MGRGSPAHVDVAVGIDIYVAGMLPAAAAEIGGERQIVRIPCEHGGNSRQQENH